MYMKTIFGAALVIGLIGAAGSALAGQRWNYPVSINETSRYAVGAMADVRGTSDYNQAIGCWNNAGPTPAAGCLAINSAGLTKSCFTYNTTVIDAIRTVSTDSYIYFQWNTDGTCAYVYIDNNSRFKSAKTSGD